MGAFYSAYEQARNLLNVYRNQILFVKDTIAE